MSSATRCSASRNLGRSSIPIAVLKKDIATNKFVYTDSDVQEHPPEGDSAPVVAFPGDDATNRAVKAYLLDVFTRTGWGLAAESPQEIRATINSFVGNGWALRNRYADNRLENICPLQIAAVEDGAVIKRKVSASVRSNIGNCIMHEMQRYFEMEDKIGDAGDGEDTLWSCSGDIGSIVEERHDSTAELNELEVQQFRKRPLSRATLPDEWMSESLRTRTKSRLSQCSEAQAPPVPKPIRFKHQPVYISKTSAYPMLVDITDKTERATSIKGAGKRRYDSPQPRGRRPDSRVSTLGMPTPKRDSPYHTIPGSCLPRPTTSFGFNSVSHATYDGRTALKSEPAQSVVGDAGDMATSITLPTDAVAEIKLPAQAVVEGVGDGTNEDAEATSHAAPPSTGGCNDAANVALSDEYLTITSPDDDENAGDVVNVTESSQHHPTTVSPDDISTNDDDSNDDDDDASIHPEEESTEPPRTRETTSPDPDRWIQTLASSPGPQPMPTLPPSPPNAYKAIPDDLETLAPQMPVSGLDAIGHIATINDIPVGSRTRRIAEREVREARARTEAATAERQQVALTKGTGRLRRWFRRVWGKGRGRKQERQVAALGTKGA
ncbi:hypothetical protein PMIN03_005112 [Paraphaeosphaeria minitans]